MNKEIRLNLVGVMDQNYELTSRVYGVDGLSPALNTCQGGGREVKILDCLCVAQRGRNPENPKSRESGLPTEQMLEPNLNGTTNALTTVQKDNLILIKQATKEGYIAMEEGGVFDASFPESTTRRVRVQEGGTVSPTLTAQNNELYRIERQAIETMFNNDCEPGDTINPFNQRVDKSGVCPTITTRPEGVKTAILPITAEYRIRKLTPKECFRLMGVDDEDADKMIAVNSNTQCYKQAGNSIVVDVMAAMFAKLF